MMRPRSALLSLSAFVVLVYPVMLWQKKRLFSSTPVMDGVTAWFWIAEPLALALLFYAASARIRQKILCYVCVVAASFFLACATAEIYFRFLHVEPGKLVLQSHDSVYVKSGQATHLEEIDGSAPDPVLGYGPNRSGKKMRFAARRVAGDEVIYDVLYSRDEEGRRITPDRGDKADTAILLFGCSYTFGMCLNDQETYAWQLGEMLGERFQVFNYGFPGYGSHQMLALIESGRLDTLVRRYKHIYASFLTITDHPVRCITNRPFQSGPHYILENGAIKYVGAFSHTVDRLFAHSQVYKQVKLPYYKRLQSDRACNTHVAIIVQAMRELKTRYNAHALTVIWPDFPHIAPMLRNNGVRTLLLTGVMPDYASVPEKYAVNKSDGHPNALANTRVAEALAEYFLKHPQAAGEQ